MGCTTSKEEREPEQVTEVACSEMNVGSPLSYPVPFGHVPYNPALPGPIALPGAMGPLWDFSTEWWYYVGWAHDRSKSKYFTVLVETLRWTPEATASHELTFSVVFYGIGTPSQEEISTSWSVGEGFSPTPGAKAGLVIPPPTSTSWSLEAHADLEWKMNMTCRLTSGTLGLPGAKYQLEMADTTHGVGVSFQLRDTFGMVLEGASGSVSKDSYEFAMPSLTIEEGSTITLDGVTTELGGGNLWLDRQSLSRSSSSSDVKASLVASAGRLSSQLYTGNWLGVVMEDKSVYVLVFYWPQKQDQWIVGSELQPPVNPTGKMGLEYPPLSNWDKQSPVQGVNLLNSSDFDLNILHPQPDPSKSPHWTSPTTGQTYCSAWRLNIRDQVYTMTALVPGSEVKLADSAFFEGAAIISDSSGREVGHAFVEQMGYAQ